jgi:hypothetical protein
VRDLRTATLNLSRSGPPNPSMGVVHHAQAIVGQFLQSFRRYPLHAKPGSFSLDQALQKMQQPINN